MPLLLREQAFELWTVSLAREEKRESRNKTHEIRSSDAYDGRLYSFLVAILLCAQSKRSILCSYCLLDAVCVLARTVQVLQMLWDPTIPLVKVLNKFNSIPTNDSASFTAFN